MSTTVRNDPTPYDAPDGRRYTELAQHLHWITPPIVLAQVAIAWVMLSLPPTAPQGGFLFGLHKSIGITIWLLIALRLTWRFTHPAPPPGPEMPRGLHLVGVALPEFLATLRGAPTTGSCTWCSSPCRSRAT